MSAKTKTMLLGILSIVVIAAGAAKALLAGVAIDWTTVLGGIGAAWAAMHATDAGPTPPAAGAA